MSKKPTNQNEGAAEAAPSFEQAIKALALMVGARVARKHFEDRGNHTETHISEEELTRLCAVGIASSLEMLQEGAIRFSAENEKKSSRIPALVTRRVVIHIARDGTINYIDTKGLKGPIIMEGTMPVASVDSVTQAEQLQKHFGTRQFRTHPTEPGKTWFILNRLPDGTVLAEKSEPYLEGKDIPEVAKMFGDWLEKCFGLGDPNES